MFDVGGQITKFLKPDSNIWTSDFSFNEVEQSKTNKNKDYIYLKMFENISHFGTIAGNMLTLQACFQYCRVVLRHGLAYYIKVNFWVPIL